jgi:hypothetical protein
MNSSDPNICSDHPPARLILPRLVGMGPRDKPEDDGGNS